SSTSAHHLHLHSFPTRRSSDLKRTPLNSQWKTATNCLLLAVAQRQTHLAALAGILKPSLLFFRFHDERWYRPRLSRVFVNGHERDRKSTRLNSSHLVISYAVFC